MVYLALENLIQYGIEKELIQEADSIYVMNRFLDILNLDEYIPSNQDTRYDLETTLNIILKDAIYRGVIEDSIVYKDMLDTKLMGVMIPFPSTVQNTFKELYKKSPNDATNYFYKLSLDSDYIRTYRIKKDVKWKTSTQYGDLDVTINLAKPEKDPKAIAAAKNQKSVSYPKCLLCKENVGAKGSMTMPARQNHRIIPITIGDKAWFLQYSPYVYYNEHCILFSGEHVPMKIESKTFSKMMDFIESFPHYFVGSNADLPIVGGSILSHDHFQGGKYTFAMDNAPVLSRHSYDKYPSVTIERLKWPLSVIRLTSENRNDIEQLATQILDHWRGYTNESAFIYAYTDQPHNTITPIARRVNKSFQLDLVLRNNITTEEHPLGVYHPHSHLHHIKKENIGLIEVMGLAVLPSRLKEEIEILKEYLVNNKDVSTNETISKHSDWIIALKKRNPNITSDNVEQIIQEEIGKIFEEVLCCAGVFKEDETFEEYLADLKFTKIS